MVIDASVAVKWIVPEEDSDVALALLGNDHVAPTLLLSEVGNALWKKKRRGEIDPSELLDDQMDSLPQLVECIGETAFTGRALQLAMMLDHPIYDCVYLAMAELFETQLVTADGRFFRKAEAAGFGGLVRIL